MLQFLINRYMPYLPFPSRGGGWGRRLFKYQIQFWRNDVYNPLLQPFGPLSLFDFSTDPVDAADARAVHERDLDGWRLSDDGVMGGYSTCQAQLIETEITLTPAIMEQDPVLSLFYANPGHGRIPSPKRKRKAELPPPPTAADEARNETMDDGFLSTSSSSSSSSSVGSMDDWDRQTTPTTTTLAKSNNENDDKDDEKTLVSSSSTTTAVTSDTTTDTTTSTTTTTTVPLAYLHWTGEIDTTVGLESSYGKSGFATLRSPKFPWRGLSLRGEYDALEIICRTHADGRVYTVNLEVESMIPNDFFRGYIVSSAPTTTTTTTNTLTNRTAQQEEAFLNRKKSDSHPPRDKNKNNNNNPERIVVAAEEKSEFSTESLPPKEQQQQQQSSSSSPPPPSDQQQQQDSLTSTKTASTRSISSSAGATTPATTTTATTTTTLSIQPQTLQQLQKKKNMTTKIRYDPRSVAAAAISQGFDVLYLPFNEFNSGLRNLEDRNIILESIGFTLMDGKCGPFAFDLARIRAVNFWNDRVWEGCFWEKENKDGRPMIKPVP